MSLIEKLIAKLPENASPNLFNEREVYSANGYNQALADVKSKLPEMIEVIKEEIEKIQDIDLDSRAKIIYYLFEEK